MAELSAVYYRDGHEGFVRFGTEAAPLAIGLNPTIAAIPTLSMIGYAGKPTVSKRTPTTPIRGGGAYRPVGFVSNRKENTVSQSLMLSGGVSAKRFIAAALRNSPTTGTLGFANTTRTMCLPNIALDMGSIGACEAARSYRVSARYGLINSLTMRGTLNGPITVEYELWPILVSSETAITQATLITAPATTIEATLVQEAGTPYMLHNAYFNVTPYGGGTAFDWQPIVEDFSITITNGLSYVGVRHPGNATTALNLSPQGIRVGNQDTSVSFTFNDRMPSEPGTLSLLLDNGVQTMTLGVEGLAINEDSDGGAEPGSPFSFTTSLSATQLTLT